eukprot:Hpha_TRINITY_DN14989_c0_g4::TRINITY_DN14989_c0_g4_i1::g.143164::m.143164/K00106/XDH; xanthine dehydrogenase/oxidase
MSTQKITDPRLRALLAPRASPAPAAAVRPAAAAVRPAAGYSAPPKGGCCSDASAGATAAAVPAGELPAGTDCIITLNGKQYTISPEKDGVDGTTTVHDWIQRVVPSARMRRGCGFGYCGACTVMITYTDPATSKTRSASVNSCLRSILSCNGQAITTAAGVGSVADPHPVQKALAENSGTQCGMCSVGMVMALYSHLVENKDSGSSALELESILDGNLCRCTGYRPIVDTYKQFAAGGTRPAADIHRKAGFGEAMEHRTAPPPFTGELPLPTPEVPGRPVAALRASVNGVEFIEATDEASLRSILSSLHKRATQPKDLWLVNGRTSQGLYQTRKPDVMVNIAIVPELQQARTTGNGVWLGAGMTIADACSFLETAKPSEPAAEVFKRIATHGKLAPGTSIRNVASIGGNVAIVYEHQNDADGPFPTEWPTLLNAADAQVEIFDVVAGTSSLHSLAEYFALDMKYKYIRGFQIPDAPTGVVYRSFKTGQRARYVHSFAAAAMRAVVTDGKIQAGSVRVVYGGLGKLPLRITEVETAMEGASVSDSTHFMRVVMPALDAAVSPCGGVGGVDYRMGLARNFLYKFYLGLQGDAVAADLKSAAEPWLTRGVTAGTQGFTADPAKFPIGKAMPKVDGLKQVTGQAQYVADIPLPAGTLHAAPVYNRTVGTITDVDVSVTKTMPGFKQFISAKDVPTGMGKGYLGDVFATGKVDCLGKLVGIVLAERQEQAVAAARSVQVSYADAITPIVTCDQAIAAGRLSKPDQGPQIGDVGKGFEGSDVVFTDVFELGNQYHYHLEKQSCLAVPGEGDSIVLHSATQMPNAVAATVAGTLNRTAGDVEVRLRRCGGGFGGKLGNSIPAACATALVSVIADAPVRFIWEYEDNLNCFGLRPSWKFVSTIGCNNDGKINAVQLRGYVNAGERDDEVAFCKLAFYGACDNCYDIKNWDVTITSCYTDMPWNTAMRGPGWVPAIFNAEHLISAVAAKVGLPIDAIRSKNYYQKNAVTPYGMTLSSWNIPELLQKAKTSCGYDARTAEVAAFNKANKWVKKGLALMPSKFSVGYSASKEGNDKMFDALVQVNRDGSVSLMSGGTEIGQGLTTKVVQTVAYTLGVDPSKVVVMEQTTSVLSQLNCDDVTGGSVSSEQSCRAAENCCHTINNLLAPVRKLLGPDATFAQVAAKAYTLGIVPKSHEASTGSPAPVTPAAHL